jgi:hypothetical protein
MEGATIIAIISVSATALTTIITRQIENNN